MMRNRPGRVSIISRESNERTLDAALLEEELLRRGFDVRVLSRLLTKEKSLKALGYAGHILKQEAAILTSDVVVLDTYCIPASMIPHRRGTKVMQIWHALSAIKKFGWQTVGREGGSSEKLARLMKMHKGYDYVAAPCSITAGHFCEAFGTDPDKAVILGLPRIDHIKSVAKGERKADALRRIRSRYPQLRESSRKLVLYAPTFRPGKAVDVRPLAGSLDLQKYDLVVRLHPLYRGDAEAAEGVIYDDDIPTYDWLSAADAVISDYSSFVIESTLADIPLYIYAYDLEEYKEKTGLNIDYFSEPISPYVFREAGDLAASLDEEYDMDRLRAFRDRYIEVDHEDRSCTEQMADFIESLIG